MVKLNCTRRGDRICACGFPIPCVSRYFWKPWTLMEMMEFYSFPISRLEDVGLPLSIVHILLGKELSGNYLAHQQANQQFLFSTSFHEFLHIHCLIGSSFAHVSTVLLPWNLFMYTGWVVLSCPTIWNNWGSFVLGFPDIRISNSEEIGSL